MKSNYYVYIHTSPNGKRYIGITKQKPERRWRNGFGYRRNKYFFSAITKYGWDNFNHEIYADNLNQEEAENLEQELIELHRSKDRKFGYNHTDGGDGTRGCFPSKETRLKMSKSKTGEKNYLFGKNLSDETKRKISESRIELCKDKKTTQMMHDVNPNKKKVYQYDLEGNLVKVWDGARKAEKEFIPGKNCQAIRKCCTGDCNGAYGYIWSYVALDKVPQVTGHRKVYQYELGGDLVKVWGNLDTAVNTFRYGVKSTVIRQCVTGHRNKAHGYIWTYFPIESR